MISKEERNKVVKEYIPQLMEIDEFNVLFEHYFISNIDDKETIRKLCAIFYLMGASDAIAQHENEEEDVNGEGYSSLSCGI